jgi:hypothetical protein
MPQRAAARNDASGTKSQYRPRRVLPLDSSDQQVFGRVGSPARLGALIPVVEEVEELPIEFGDSLGPILVEPVRRNSWPVVVLPVLTKFCRARAMVDQDCLTPSSRFSFTLVCVTPQGSVGGVGRCLVLVKWPGSAHTCAQLSVL